MSEVIASELCPSRLLTTAIGTPAASMRLACPWRRSWSRTGRSPAASESSRNRLVTVSGCSGVPSSLVKTWPLSTQASPLVAMLLLAKLVAEQGTDGGLVEVDDAVLTAGGLDRAEVGAVAELDDLTAHGEPGPFDVDVVPLQAEELTTS